MILQSIEPLLRERGLIRRVSEANARVEVQPLPGASPAAIAAVLGDRVSGVIVVVADTPGGGDEVFDDLRSLTDDDRVRYFPQRETLPYEDADPHLEISGQRVEALGRMLSGRARLLVRHDLRGMLCPVRRPDQES